MLSYGVGDHKGFTFSVILPYGRVVFLRCKSDIETFSFSDILFA